MILVVIYLLNKEMVTEMKVKYNNENERLCEGCGESLGSHTMRWCITCEEVYNKGLKDGLKESDCIEGSE